MNGDPSPYSRPKSPVKRPVVSIALLNIPVYEVSIDQALTAFLCGNGCSADGDGTIPVLPRKY
jgi:hypothetical protein